MLNVASIRNKKVIHNHEQIYVRPFVLVQLVSS